MNELTPCPFCCSFPPVKDRPAEADETSSTGKVWSITCYGDRINAHAWFFADTREAVVEAWNTRAPTPLSSERREEDWPISKDGPHVISDHRRWLARQLMDSKLSEPEAISVVSHSPDVKDAILAGGRVEGSSRTSPSAHVADATATETPISGGGGS